uniref:hypothetical protein n=1 Tax=Burkholderia vietnamiensis TaxID=60552 RepID=UPI001E582E5C
MRQDIGRSRGTGGKGRPGKPETLASRSAQVKHRCEAIVRASAGKRPSGGPRGASGRASRPAHDARVAADAVLRQRRQKKGSSRITGEGGADLEEEVFIVTVPV